MSSTADTAQPLSHAEPQQERTGITLAVIVSFMLLVGVDSTIVNMALPHVQDSLHFSTASLSWVLNAYTLAFGGLLLLGGRLGDVFGRRSVFTAGVLVFTAASLLGGLAASSWWLLAARAGQGVGAALAAPSTMALIATNFEGNARAKALAVYSAVMGAGASVGLIIGGVLTDAVSWRWVLFVNVPLGVGVALLAPRYVKQPGRNPGGGFDILGALTSTIGMVSLVYAFIKAASDGWSDGTTRISFVVAAVFLALFLVVETRVAKPLTPMHLFKNRTIAGAFLSTLFLTAAMFSVLFLLSQYLQEVADLSPTKAGLAFLPMTLAQFGSVRLVPKLLPTLGHRRVLLIGSTLLTVGMAWLTRIDVDSNYFAAVFGPLLLIGTGVGISFPTLNMSILSRVQPAESGSASGMLQAIQWMGGSLGLAVWVTVFGAAGRDAAAHHTAATAEARADYVMAGGVSAAFVAAGISAALGLLVVALTFRKELEQKKTA
ncbi:MFS transporter [Kitasatospora purpeofusca]|uniref:MFS transporter n=1 Tax=Kitasatospora purpeofusca TaxID=67352 RepID=UPI0035DBB608